ncbi:AfsR/SARP family transcriptional regulator [Gordonia aquimaris]|uniref:BTAD domain-containing putative transcriptional regulator n=1 Tax=Gordonia aquimaris TaxID=2984863 RepID=A0A9X3I6J6_9ACTN|nr:AfsR/SARP family transcriptional regulator [Gordonia aquimaris]MCX2966371.1 BTAD domain-containing putative transcriptional regulator [Gordonia aquimaris]
MSMDVEAGPVVSITLSGTVRADVDGRPAEIKSRRGRAVLARLAAADGRVVSTDRLIDDLWNGEPPPKALAGLQVHISNLRRILEPQRAPRTPARILVSEPPGYALHLPRDAVDLWRFADLAGTAGPDPAGRYARLGEAQSLWRGDPFGPHAADEWAGPEVARLDELWLHTVEQRAAAALDLGRAAEVVAELPALCETHSTREELFGLLALAQYRLGRQADALRTLRTLREYLADELGVDPSVKIRTLESDILQQDPALDAPTATRAPEAPPTVYADPPEVDRSAGPEHRESAGRESELEKLAEHAETARRTGLRIVWITAEAGGGKTTLARTFGQHLRASGWVTAFGQCPEVDGAPTAWAWREVVAELDGDNEIDDPFLIARQVRGACESRSADGSGVALLIDDTHRADSATLQVLRQLVTWLADRPALVVATYRPSEASIELLATAAALISATADHLVLAGLSDDGIRALAADAGLDPVDDPTLALLRSRTDGNPLFVRELAKLVASRGTRDAQTAVPSGVREVLLRRVERLPEQTVTMLRLAAVCGRECDVDTIIGLWPDDDAEDTVLDAIDSAVVAGLLSAEADRVRFTHVLMRDAVYDAIPTLRRRRLHWRTMQLLAARNPTVTDELAVHAALGASSSTADDALRIVEEAARHRFSSEFAADSAPLWQHAVDLHDLAGHARSTASADDRVRMVHALCDLVTALAHRGEISAARARREDALRLARTVDDPALVVAALTCWRTPWIWSTRTKGVPDEVMTAAVLDALAGATGIDRVRLLISAVFEFEGSDDAFAIECAEEALRLARDADDVDLLCAALNARVFTALGPDSRDQYSALAAEFLDLTQESGNRGYEAAARFYLFLLRMSQIDLPGAVAQMQAGMQCATSGRVGELVVVLSAFSAVTDVLRGELDSAAAKYTALSAQLRAAGMPAGGEFDLIGHLCVGWFRGSIGHLVDEVAAVFERTPHAVGWVYVDALIDAGRIDEARAIAETDPYTSRDYYWTSMEVFHARALVKLGMVDEAARLYRLLVDWSGTIAGLNAASVSFGPIDVVLAELADLIGEHAAAERHRQIAADVEEKVRRGLAAIS